ncbi:hypothetical protein PC116_g28424 [Phytophthora cactorum]|nr:hypothetical protein PC116_g28424 [Phytophthora cactorum]
MAREATTTPTAMPAFAPPDKPSPDEPELGATFESEAALVALGAGVEVEDESPDWKSSTVTLKQGG